MSPDALTVALAAEVRNRFDTPCYVYDHSELTETNKYRPPTPNRFLHEVWANERG